VCVSVRVSVCVCERERVREREGGGGGERERERERRESAFIGNRQWLTTSKSLVACSNIQCACSTCCSLVLGPICHQQSTLWLLQL
jgi:hypothetical protein